MTISRRFPNVWCLQHRDLQYDPDLEVFSQPKKLVIDKLTERKCRLKSLYVAICGLHISEPAPCTGLRRSELVDADEKLSPLGVCERRQRSCQLARRYVDRLEIGDV